MGQELRIRMSAIEDEHDEAEDDAFGGDEGRGTHGHADPDDEIPRRETGYRIALTILFAIIGGAIRTVLGLIVLFELLLTLITRRPPGLRVRDLANRITTYYYELLRYITYNESRVPFPFSDFPDPLEPDAFDARGRESEALGLREKETTPLVDDVEAEDDRN